MHDPKLRSNLSAQVSNFIGREAELAEVRRLVAGSRLVTLTGTGGAGKTRLGLQLAAELLDRAGEGVWFADLAALGEPDLVAETVADVLGIHREPGRQCWTRWWRRWADGVCWCCWTTASTSSALVQSSPPGC